MDFFGTLLWPLRWLIELILVLFHRLFTQIGLNPDDGWTWILAITGLVIVVRSAIIPLMIRQIKSQRAMMEVTPELKKIQDKYRGKRDQFSMEAMRRETTELYQRSGTNPMASCWPLLVQMPIFFALFSVLNTAQHDQPGVGMLTQELSRSFASSSIFGAPLSATFMNNGGNVTVVVIAVIMIVVMSVSQYIVQKQIMSKNVSQATKESPMYQQQKILLYILPLVFAVSGVAFPLGVMSYWLISNFWTVGQQWLIVRNLPTPGSEAAKAREERLRRRGKWVDPESADPRSADEQELKRPETTQRQQPMSKARAKKQAAQQGGSAHRSAKQSKDGDGKSGSRSSGNH